MKKIYHSRLEFITEALETSAGQPRTFLDVGFLGDIDRTGFHYSLVDSLSKSDKLVGIDIDEDQVQRFLESPETQRRLGEMDLSYQVMSVLETDLEAESFDVVLMLEVFEHLPRPYTVFDEVLRILKPGGHLIMTYPNPLALNSMLKFVLQKDIMDPEFLKDFKGDPQHLIFPHPLCLLIYLRQAGFDVQRIEFLKYGFKKLGFMKRLLGRCPLTRRLSADVGFHAIKR